MLKCNWVGDEKGGGGELWGGGGETKNICEKQRLSRKTNKTKQKLNAVQKRGSVTDATRAALSTSGHKSNLL
jgi:hypothetical protein